MELTQMKFTQEINNNYVRISKLYFVALEY
jgi:hypothetical protein